MFPPTIMIAPTSEIEQYYRSCDIFIMSSTYEPFGQTTIEAIASGLRVAAFHGTSGVKTAVHELGLDDAITYAMELSGEALAKAIIKSLEKTTIAKCLQASFVARSSYDWDQLFESLLEPER